MSVISHETGFYNDHDKTIGDRMLEIAICESRIAQCDTRKEVLIEACQRGVIDFEKAVREFDDVDQLRYITEYSRKRETKQIHPSEPLRRRISRIVFRR